jgi:hypothetical protein
MPLSRRRFLAQSSLLTAASTLLPRTIHAQTGAPAGASDAYAKPKPDVAEPTPPVSPKAPASVAQVARTIRLLPWSFIAEPRGRPSRTGFFRPSHPSGVCTSGTQ